MPQADQIHKTTRRRLLSGIVGTGIAAAIGSSGAAATRDAFLIEESRRFIAEAGNVRSLLDSDDGHGNNNAALIDAWPRLFRSAEAIADVPATTRAGLQAKGAAARAAHDLEASDRDIFLIIADSVVVDLKSAG